MNVLDRFNSTRQEQGSDPLNPILVAAMTASATLASEGAKDRNADQAAAVKKPTITIKPDDTIEVKGLPIVDPVDKGKREAEKPFRDLFEMLDRAGLVKSDEDPYAPDLQDGVKGYRESYGKSRALGNDPIVAAIHGLQTRRMKPEDAAVEYRRERVNNLLDKAGFSSPKALLDEAQQQRNAGATERRNAFAALNTIIDNGAGSYDSEDTAINAAKGQLSAAGFQWDDAFAEPVRQRFRTDRSKATTAAATARRQAFRDRFTSIRKDDVVGYEANEYDRFKGDRYGDIELTPEEDAQLRNRFAGLQDARQEEVTDRAEDRKRFEILVAKFDAGTREKPALVTYTEAKEAPASYLIEQIGNPNVNQKRLFESFRWKEQALVTEKEDLERKRRGARTRATAMRERGEEPDAHDEKADAANDRLKVIETELAAVRAARKQGSPGQPVAVGVTGSVVKSGNTLRYVPKG